MDYRMKAVDNVLSADSDSRIIYIDNRGFFPTNMLKSISKIDDTSFEYMVVYLMLVLTVLMAEQDLKEYQLRMLFTLNFSWPQSKNY